MFKCVYVWNPLSGMSFCVLASQISNRSMIFSYFLSSTPSLYHTLFTLVYTIYASVLLTFTTITYSSDDSSISFIFLAKHVCIANTYECVFIGVDKHIKMRTQIHSHSHICMYIVYMEIATKAR